MFHELRKSYLTLGHTCKVIRQPWDRWWGEADGPPPPAGFLICCSISKRFSLQWKSFDFLHKIWHILWKVALLEICDATKHGRHLRLHLGFYQELEIR